MASLVLTDAQIVGALGDNAKKTISALPNYWNGIIARAHARAVGDIQARLAARGYSLAQITSSDQVASYENDQTLYWAMKNGGILEGFSDSSVKDLDVRSELKEAVLTANGAFINPAGPVGIPGSGIQNAPDDIFLWPPQDGSDPTPSDRLGDPSGTRW